MAIDFVKKQKSQKRLLIISLVIIVLIAIILFWFFGKDNSSNVPPENVSLPSSGEIKINFAVLDKIKRFQPFTFIEPLEEEEGRDNPFLPY